MSRLPKFNFQKKAQQELGERINNILYLVIFALGLIIILGTIIGFLTHKAKLGKNLRTPDPSPSEIESLNRANGTNLAAYTGLGTFRITTKPQTEEEGDYGNLLVLSPWFSYPQEDIAYFEELSRKRVVISGIITNYFINKNKAEILDIPEDKIKADLLEEINGQLSLGKIEELYFTEYIFLD